MPSTWNHGHEPDIYSPCLECYRLGAHEREGREGRIPCQRCGMIGNLDPELHRRRYGHWPVLPGGDELQARANDLNAQWLAEDRRIEARGR